ncbi:hypothetical protein MTR_3g117010 [Medicago truncatula]|uniref:Uncharacterized protein n=1 Tax=Medicago truncatula TaxID=3880 RepID=G7J758_MEDTR|nr:hypothetical protein MTR_3g117010 [Medicago truncatula]
MVEYSSSSVSGSTLNHRTKLVCYCGVDSPLVTSWTDENPGRRFHGCGTSLFSFLFFHGCGTNWAIQSSIKEVIPHTPTFIP